MSTLVAPHPRSGKPIAVIKRWRPLNIDNPPTKCGVYAIKSADQWLYIGRSVNIGTRIKSRYHPVRITVDLCSLELSYWWHPVDREMLPRTESHLIDKFQPEWNGGTSFESTHHPPYPSCRALIPLSEPEHAAMEKRIHDHLYKAACILFGKA
jgi:hypothetical protein